MRTGIANLPLHHGRAPRWLFERMRALSREILRIVVEEYGPHEVLRRLSDPFWFQAFGCLLGFDWHSSGLTTTVCGAIKEGLRGLERDLGLFACGGKGRTSLNTPLEIESKGDGLDGDVEGLKYASRMVAKIDNAALQDGYRLYHHFFIFTRDGTWAVIQQGLNEDTGYARRYHWLSEGLGDLFSEPHKAICCDRRAKALNLVARESEGTRSLLAELSRERPERVLRDLSRVLHLPRRHSIGPCDVDPRRLYTILLSTYERQPRSFTELFETRGVGPKTLRALALIGELIYGVEPSWRDPARYSFAHGGKDGHPYPVERGVYDRSIEILRDAARRAKVDRTEKIRALRRLESWTSSRS